MEVASVWSYRGNTYQHIQLPYLVMQNLQIYYHIVVCRRNSSWNIVTGSRSLQYKPCSGDICYWRYYVLSREIGHVSQNVIYYIYIAPTNWNEYKLPFEVSFQFSYFLALRLKLTSTNENLPTNTPFPCNAQRPLSFPVSRSIAVVLWQSVCLVCGRLQHWELMLTPGSDARQ